MSDNGLRIQHERLLQQQREQAGAARQGGCGWTMDADTLRRAIVWAEILKEPVCRRRNDKRYGDKGNIGR